MWTVCAHMYKYIDFFYFHCEAYVCFSQSILLFSLVKFTPLRYNTYQFPRWGYALGLFLAFSSVLVAPLWFLYSLAVTPGTLRQVL